MGQRPEESWSDTQSETIDEEDEAEALGIVEHGCIHGQSEMPGHDAHEENEGHAERDAPDLHLAQSEAHGTDQRQDDNRLHG